MRTAASTGSQNLIYLQDIFADLYGPTFSAKEHCNRFGARPGSEYQSNLAQRLKDRNSLDGVRAQRVINMMLNTLYAVGLASHAPPIPPPVTTPPPPQGQGGTNTNPPANTPKVQIDSARLNKRLDQGNKGDGQYWLKSIVLCIDTDERQIAKNLAFNSEVPQVDQSFTLTRGRHKFLFRLEFDSKRLEVHKQFTRDYLGDVEVDQDLALTPFVTVKAGEITQCVLLKKSDPIPDRTAP